jgi:predicted ferric reductase
MNQTASAKPAGSPPASMLVKIMVALFLGICLATFAAVGSYIYGIATGQSILSELNWLFAASSTQLMWYVTRAAGITAYLLLWFSMLWGLLVPTKLLDPILERSFTFDFHQFLSLLAVGFILVHVLVLLLDRYLPYSWTQILVPFLSPYRPFWVGVGGLAFYLILLVTITFYLRRRIGMNTFRSLHGLSFLGYLGATLHGLFSGTDTALPAVKLMYASTALVVVFLGAYWFIWKEQQKRAKTVSLSMPKAPVQARTR